MAGLETFENEARQLSQALDKLKSDLEGLLVTSKKLDAEFSEGAQSASNLNSRLKGVDKTTDQLSLSEKELLRIQKASQKVTVETAKAQIQLTEKRKAARREAERQLGITKKQIPFTKKLGNAFKSAALSVVGFTAVIYAAVRAITGIVKLNAEFQKSLSSLSAITGLTGKDLDFFAQQAIKISKATLQSANDIVKAYELVGSIRPELLKNKEALAEVTKQAIILSEATGGKLGLEGAAKAVAGTLNQFSLSADDAARATNALAAGSKFGSATADLVTESFSKFGAVANAANITMEQSVALTEILAEKQMFGAESGTALRGTILRLQKAGVGYVSGQFNINDALEEANKLLNEQTDNVKRDQLAIKLFGDRNILAGNILVSNIKKFEDMTEAVTDTTTAIEQQAIQNDNLSANWQKLTNRIKNAFIVTGEGSGFLNEIVKGLLRAVDAVSRFGFVFVAAAKVTVLAIKSIIAPTMVLVDAFAALSESVVAVLKGDFKALKGIMNSGLDSIKERVLNLKDSYVDAGQAIKDSYNESMSLSDEIKDSIIEEEEKVKELVETHKITADEITAAAEKRIMKQKELLIKGEINEDQFAARILAINIATQKAILDKVELTEKERLRIKNKYLDFQVQLEKNFQKEIETLFTEGDDLLSQIYNDSADEREKLNQEVIDSNIEGYNADVEAYREAEEEKRQLKVDIGNSLFDFSQSLYERELANLQEQEAYKLSLVKGNEEAEQKIREDFAKKRADIQRKQAITDKLQALFNIGINTAQGIMSALAMFPPNIPLSILIGTLGAIQAATVAAKPLPKFAKGVKDFEGGQAIVGEQGRELLITPSGGVSISPDTSTQVLLPSGTDVIPHYETEKMIQGGIMPEKFDELIAETKATRKALENRPIKETNLTDKGFKKMVRHNNSVTEFIDTYMRS